MPDLASISSWFDTWIRHFHGPAIYLICGLLVFGEAGFMLGFVIPGETAALVGGALAALGNVSLGLMLAVIVVSAILGDSLGYEVGKHFGPWLMQRRPLRGYQGVDRATAMIQRRGGPAVFLGRWVAVGRAMVPGITGMSGMRYRTFLAYNAAGGLVWGTTFVLIGYAAGKSYQRIAQTIGTYALGGAGVLIGVIVVVSVIRRRRTPGLPVVEAATTEADPPSGDRGSAGQASPT